MVVVVVFTVSTTLRFVIGCGLDPLGAAAAGAEAFLTVLVVDVVLPGTNGTRFVADGADTAWARAEADPADGFLAAVVVVAVAADAGRAVDRGALVAEVAVCEE